MNSHIQILSQMCGRLWCSLLQSVTLFGSLLTGVIRTHTWQLCSCLCFITSEKMFWSQQKRLWCCLIHLYYTISIILLINYFSKVTWSSRGRGRNGQFNSDLLNLVNDWHNHWNISLIIKLLSDIIFTRPTYAYEICHCGRAVQFY